VPLPERLGRLRRVERLGVGGFATVWLYHDPELRSDVAVKALAENWAQRIDVRERFLDEARILRQADSDHIVRVYDIGEAEGTPYFVMTYADQGSLATLLEDGARLSPDRTMELVAQAGAGLAMLHEHGIVHRDIKPQNLLLRSSGGGGDDRLLVADLGVAKALLHASGLTQVVGTPSYMAPEQAAGLGIDVRADVHALAAVTYQMLTGELVREGGIAELAHATLPRPASEYVELPEAVDDVLLRGLEPDPEDRWPDMVSFVSALRAAMPTPEPTDRESLTLWAMPRVSPRRAPAAAVLAPWLVTLLVFVAAFGAAYTVTTLVR
jgi:serine/threonine protein kinase